MIEKLFLVKREVLARTIQEAMRKDGKIYSVEEASEKDQPQQEKKVDGFINKTK